MPNALSLVPNDMRPRALRTSAGFTIARIGIAPMMVPSRVPQIAGLYLSGPFMHPGGTVTLGGRATAMVLYQDLGIPLSRGFEI